jgi:hypothetical protein
MLVLHSKCIILPVTDELFYCEVSLPEDARCTVMATTQHPFVPNSTVTKKGGQVITINVYSCLTIISFIV